jgi:hypothetical protein
MNTRLRPPAEGGESRERSFLVGLGEAHDPQGLLGIESKMRMLNLLTLLNLFY